METELLRDERRRELAHMVRAALEEQLRAAGIGVVIIQDVVASVAPVGGLYGWFVEHNDEPTTVVGGGSMEHAEEACEAASIATALAVEEVEPAITLFAAAAH